MEEGDSDMDDAEDDEDDEVWGGIQDEDMGLDDMEASEAESDGDEEDDKIENGKQEQDDEGLVNVPSADLDVDMSEEAKIGQSLSLWL